MAEGKVFGYARVSSKGQNEARQVSALIEAGVSERDIYIDKISGKSFDNREQYLALRNSVLREGDTLIVKSLDRFSRNKSECKAEIEHLKKIGVRFKCLDIPSTCIEVNEENSWIMDMISNLLIEVLASISEDERNRIRTRQKEGIVEAHKNNVKFGRPRIDLPDNYDEVMNLVSKKELNDLQAMKLLNMSKTTYYRRKKAKEEM